MRKVVPTDYTIMVHKNKSKNGAIEWIASCSELPFVVSSETTADEACESLYEKIQFFLDEEKRDPNFKLNPPNPVTEYSNLSGRITFRTSKTTHYKLVTRANEEGVSLNSLINMAVDNLIAKPSKNEYEEILTLLRAKLI